MLLETKQLLAYILPMPRKPIELPPAVARKFLADLRRLFRREKPIKRDEIAASQAWLLSEHFGPREKKLRVIDVKKMFLQMRDQS